MQLPYGSICCSKPISQFSVLKTKRTRHALFWSLAKGRWLWQATSLALHAQTQWLFLHSADYHNELLRCCCWDCAIVAKLSNQNYCQWVQKTIILAMPTWLIQMLQSTHSKEHHNLYTLVCLPIWIVMSNWQSASYAVPYRVPNIQLHHDWCILVMLLGTEEVSCAWLSDSTTLASVLFRKNPCLQFSYVSTCCRGAADVSCLHPDRLWTAEQLHVCNVRQAPPYSMHMEAAKHVCTWQLHWQKDVVFCMLTGNSEQLHLQCKRKQYQKVLQSCAIFDVASSCMAPVVSLEACHHAEQCVSLWNQCRLVCRQLQRYWCCTATPVSVLAIDSTVGRQGETRKQ